jgi:AcrR family transcriptional regulator
VSKAALSRSERREHTRQRILVAARESFGERGFERTTIRRIAARAGVDPALVIQHFGSKRSLFSEAASAAPDEALRGESGQLTEFLLLTIGMKIDDLSETSLTTMRSMLTDPEAAERARAVLDRQVQQIAAAITGDEAQLRAALIVATMLGMRIARQLLAVTALRTPSPQHIANVLRPALEAMIND